MFELCTVFKIKRSSLSQRIQSHKTLASYNMQLWKSLCEWHTGFLNEGKIQASLCVRYKKPFCARHLLTKLSVRREGYLEVLRLTSQGQSDVLLISLRPALSRVRQLGRGAYKCWTLKGPPGTAVNSEKFFNSALPFANNHILGKLFGLFESQFHYNDQDTHISQKILMIKLTSDVKIALYIVYYIIRSLIHYWFGNGAPM